MLFEYLNYNVRYSVVVCKACIFVGALAGPLPIVGISGIDIYGHPEAVHAVAMSAGDISPCKSTADIGEVFL